MRSSTIHASLNRPRLTAGVGSELFLTELLLALAFGLLQAYALLLVLPPLHAFLRWVYRLDPIALAAYRRYAREADLYDPWTHDGARAMRPRGFGRELLL